MISNKQLLPRISQLLKSKVHGLGEGVRGAQMGGVCVRDVGHVVCGDILHVREHIAGDKEQHGFQPEAGGVLERG